MVLSDVWSDHVANVSKQNENIVSLQFLFNTKIIVRFGVYAHKSFLEHCQ